MDTQITSWSGIVEDTTPVDYVLNPSNMNKFIQECIYEDNNLYVRAGRLEQCKNKTVNIFLSRDLSADKWQELLHNCRLHGVTLNIVAAAGISKPGSDINLAKEVLPNLGVTLEDNARFDNQTSIIQTNDLDATVTKLLYKHELNKNNPIVIDITEYEASDLLYKLKIQANGDNNGTFKFSAQVSDIIQKLIDGATVILKGKFSNDLSDALASLCLKQPFVYINGKKQTISGKLLLVGRASPALNFTKHYLDRIDVRQKKQCLAYHGVTEQNINSLEGKLIENKITDPLERYSMAQILTMCNYLRTNPKANPLDIWKGVYDLPDVNDGGDMKDLNSLKLDAAINSKFLEDRLAIVQAGLKTCPFVFISGITGVGKSTFVHKYLSGNGYKIFSGENKLGKWATAPEDSTTNVLFIDEANISNQDYSKFESLFYQPPSILIDGKVIPLTERHKVIFAGNPVSYGGERHLPSLIAQHGGAVFFDIIPAAALYHNVLKVVLGDGIHDNDLKEKIAKIFIQTYQQIFALDKEVALISPRELQAMAELLVASISQAQPEYSEDEIINLCKNIALNFSQSLVPIDKLAKFNAWFIKAINNGNDLLDSRSRIVTETTDFTLTESRIKAHQIMEDVLNVRKFKQSTASEKKLGGINGLVLEGEPGTGKSHCVIDYLVTNGFKEVKLDDKTPQSGNIFYKLPVKMSPKDKEACLIKAFNEGAVVVIDEINSSPMMEQLLNDLLTGQHGKKTATTPGFTIFATQNPIDMAGRRATSEALQRRMFKCCLEVYSTADMKKILVGKGLDGDLAEKYIQLYQTAIEIAHRDGRKPVPVFRDLVEYARKQVRKIDPGSNITIPTEKSVLQQNLLFTKVKGKKQAQSTTNTIESRRDQNKFK